MRWSWPASLWTLAFVFLAGVSQAGDRPLAARSLLLDVARAGERWVAVGIRGHIVVSDDGRRWRQVQSPVDVLLTAVRAGPGGRLWAVGHDAVVLRSDDRGLHWQRVFADPEADAPLLDLWMDAEGRRGIAVGAYSRYLVTEDAGAHWRSQAFPLEPSAAETADDADPVPLDVHLNAIAQARDGTLYIAAEAGRVFRSDDGGRSWRRLPSPYVGSLFGVLPLKAAGHVLVFGLRGHLFRSEDRGAHWTPVRTGTQEMLTDGVRLPDGRVVLVGLGGTVLVSRDAGRTFAARVLPDRRGLAAVAAAPGGGVLVAGEAGVLRLDADWLEGVR